MEQEQHESELRDVDARDVDPGSGNRNAGSHRGRAISEQIGFYLWRGGLAFSGSYLAVRGFIRGFRAVLELGVPVQLAVGLSFILIGFVLLFGSLIVERVLDARSERGLRDM